jgi:hypothetical protein
MNGLALISVAAGFMNALDLLGIVGAAQIWPMNVVIRWNGTYSKQVLTPR